MNRVIQMLYEYAPRIRGRAIIWSLPTVVGVEQQPATDQVRPLAAVAAPNIDNEFCFS
jgi:hypothetical protein